MKAPTKKKGNLPRSVKGRDGWRFVFRDQGQVLRVADYAPVKLSRSIRGTGPRKAGGKTRYNPDKRAAQKEKLYHDALKEFRAGRFIPADVFVRLCREHGVRLTKIVWCQCRYMNELDISTRTLRHKNSRGDYQRYSFEGLFSAIQFLVAETMHKKLN